MKATPSAGEELMKPAEILNLMRPRSGITKSGDALKDKAVPLIVRKLFR